MPTRAHRVCAEHGCSLLVRGTGNRCMRHEAAYQQKERARIARLPKGPGAAHYRSAAWRQLRRRILQRDPICRACGRAKATDVDHVLPRRAGGTDHESNLIGLCHPCHSRKTARADGGFGNPNGVGL